MDKKVEIGGQMLKLTNLDKVLWPESSITKSSLIAYFADIHELILPHLKDRPLVVTRYPNGIQGKSFYQKNCPDYAPEWIQTFPIQHKKSSEPVNYILCNDLPTLIWLANQACLELHPWYSRTGSLEYPDYAVFDIDPAAGTDFSDAVQVAFHLKDLLKRLNLKSWVKTSGATGLHIFVPLDPNYDYQTVERFVELAGALLARAFPDDITVYDRRVEDRTGRVYIDYLQNKRGRTLVGPYSPRPQKGAPISMPLQWSKLKQELNPAMYNINKVRSAEEEIQDSWSELLSCRQNLNEALQVLDGQ